MNHRRIIRIGLWGTLCVFILTLNTGCVYWRLHQFRNQMSAFPDYYRIEERDLPTIIAQRPVLQPDDLGWLTGLPASKTLNTGSRTTEIYHYIKQYADPADDEEGRYDIYIPARFNADGKLYEVQAPSRFAPVLSEKNFEEVFRPMKHGSIERLDQATGWSWEDHRINIPTREGIRDLFGAPHSREALEEGLTYYYGYLLEGSETRWNPTDWDISIRFVFEPEEERVIFSETYMGRLHVVVDLRAEKNLVHIKRL